MAGQMFVGGLSLVAARVGQVGKVGKIASPHAVIAEEVWWK